jgi:hypothetical protein
MIHQIISQRRPTATPETFNAHRAPLVSDAVACHLTLELCEREEHVHDQPAQAVCSVEVLRNARKRNFVPLKNVHQPYEIKQTPAQPIKFVDDDDVNTAPLDVGQQLLYRGSVEGRAGLGCILVDLA